MRINEIAYWLGDVFETSFKILPILGNAMNYLIIGVGLVLMLIWIKKMFDFNKEADRQGTLR